MTPIIKICGLSTAATLDAALDAGSNMLGFVFFPPSPRNISYETARALAAQVKTRAQKVSLTVDASDEVFAALIDALHPDILQLHGNETPERVAELKRKFGIPVMKAISVSEAHDLAAIARYEPVADRILFDSKPPKLATRPGGNGLAFDWSLVASASIRLPWILSGGLTPENVAEAIAITRAQGVDVSSGVESTPGVKDPARIVKFVEQARAAMRTL
jgi:phosphoribosylanthranilate isomerase